MASVTKTITETVDGSGNPSVTTSLYFASFEDFMEYERVGVMNSGTTVPVSIAVDESRVETAQSPLTKLEVGKQYRVIEEVGDILLPKGTVFVVVGNVDSDGEYKAELLDGSNFWYVKPEEVEEI